jgi:Delta24-sterol reductase
VRVGDLNAVLHVSLGIGRAFVRVEPGITVGELTEFLSGEGYMLEQCIEMRDATIGGLILSLGMTSHSHMAGLVHDSALSYELVTADGGLVMAKPDNDHADLFRAIPWSHGTLGILVAVELRVIPCPGHVRVTYHPTHSLAECHALLEDLALAGDEPYYLEAFVYARDRAVVVEATMASWREVSSGGIQVNEVGAWHKPWFYKHAEAFLDTVARGGVAVELVPTQDYLMRHDRSMCMTMGQVCPEAHARLYRLLLGWLLPPDVETLKRSRPPQEREASVRQQVFQDYCAPASRFPALVDWLDRNLSIYPLLVYPCKIIDNGGMVRLRSNRGKPVPATRVERSLYLDVGIFGRPKAVREGDARFPTISKVRELDAMVREWGGFQHTYCDVFATREEFEEMFDHTLWRRMRTKYGAQGVFPTVYDKVTPEVDIAAFLREEQAWL